jgi:hypothetical protein
VGEEDIWFLCHGRAFWEVFIHLLTLQNTAASDMLFFHLQEIFSAVIINHNYSCWKWKKMTVITYCPGETFKIS